MMAIFRLIPKKVWIVLGVALMYLSSIYFANTYGKREGYLKAERDFNKASLSAIESSVEDLNSKLAKAIATYKEGLQEAHRLSQKVFESNVTHNNNYQELLNEAKKKGGSSGGDCSELSAEYIKLFQSIYPQREQRSR